MGLKPTEIELHGHRVSYRRGGSGPALLLLHGIANSSETWEPVAEELCRHFTVIAPDLLGHGESATPRGDYSLGAHASGLRDLLARNGFSVVQHRKTLANAAILFQLANAYIYKLAWPRSQLAMGVWTIVLMCPISLLGLLASALSPDNEDLFLDQVVLATRNA